MKNKILNTTVNPVRLKRTYRAYPKSPNGLENFYVGRPSVWGNPYWLRGKDIYSKDDVLVKEDGTIEDVIKLYEEHILHYINNNRVNISELKNKNLVCWCDADKPCHADVLIRLAK